MKAETEIFNMLLVELLRTSHYTTTKVYWRNVDEMIKNMPRTYLGIDITVAKKIPVWVANENKELAIFRGTYVLN